MTILDFEDDTETLKICDGVSYDLDKVMYRRGLANREEVIAQLARDGLKSRWPMPLAIFGLFAAAITLSYIVVFQGVRFQWVF